MSERLPKRAGESIRRDRPFTFEFEGRRFGAFHGDTVGSALAAAGVSIASRSFKYHRPRGLLCMTGSCPNCLMQIDGIPNVRACTEPVHDGMRVRRQNAWPSANRDVYGWINVFSFMLPPGFYYKLFHRPRWAWPLVEPFIRSQAGLGEVPRGEDHRPREVVNRHCDVLVIGAGAAGLAAAAQAARAGAKTLVVEEQLEAGGSLRREATLDARNALLEEARSAGATIWMGTPAFGVFGGRLVAAAGRDRLYRIRARQLVVATGAVEQTAVFPNNDRPGIMLSSAVDLLVNRFAVLPGRRAVVLTGGERGYASARTLRAAGAAVTVVDLRPQAHSEPKIEVVAGSTILAVRGRRRVRQVLVGDPSKRTARSIPCDIVVLAGFDAPSTNLLAMMGAEAAFDERAQAFLPVALPAGVHAAGAVAGAASTEIAVAQGRLAGVEAASACGFDAGRDETIMSVQSEAARRMERVVLPPETCERAGKRFACVCMDVTDKELKTAVAEGFDSLELLKRYTTITMGPCQGKACMSASQRLCAAATGSSFERTGPTTARPPWTPVELGTLAGWRRTPRKETAMHDQHTEAGAKFMWAGDWRRPHRYAAGPDTEVEAVRTRVGVIDVSSLGKFRIKGPGAVELLERLYPNRFSDLRVGRVRYVLMLNDEGVVLDDGAVCRLDEDEFFITVTTGNTAAIEQWVTWWNAIWRLPAQVLNMTGAYAALNLAGPSARDVLGAVTAQDVSRESMPYMSVSRIQVAEVSALVLRIGFVGELGYEIHVPSMYGEHVWDAVVAAGAPHGIERVGLEAQRILRLEKQHILVGQDTDAESDPYELGMKWVVKTDKEDFLGKRGLMGLDRKVSERLVGFTCSDEWLPPEGASVVQDGAWVGRVTSSRRSATVGRVVGLAWVPSGWADEGTRFEIEFGSRRTEAEIHLRPFYDPDGQRLRS